MKDVKFKPVSLLMTRHSLTRKGLMNQNWVNPLFRAPWETSWKEYMRSSFLLGKTIKFLILWHLVGVQIKPKSFSMLL